MGLDVVELVLECEQVFAISLDDHKLATTTHVGHLFELICTELHLPLATAAPPPGINRLSRPLDNRPLDPPGRLGHSHRHLRRARLHRQRRPGFLSRKPHR